MLDIHSNTLAIGAIYNLTIEELRLSPSYFNKQQWLSVGLHPWFLTEEWQKDFLHVRRWAMVPQVKAIGEAGLDRLSKSPCQHEAFLAHVELSEEIKKPLLIHCVKAVDEIIKIHRSMDPKQPWIFHGFRGKPQQAEQLLKEGFYLSFGEHFNLASVQICPADKLCMETDDSNLSIEEIEKRIRKVRQSELESFSKDLLFQ
jgi:TatD DNase family protein